MSVSLLKVFTSHVLFVCLYSQQIEQTDRKNEKKNIFVIKMILFMLFLLFCCSNCYFSLLNYGLI